LRHTILGLEEENDKLRSTMREMVDDYTKQLELRDENLREWKLINPQEELTIHKKWINFNKKTVA